MEIPPEEEQGRVQSQHRASRARRLVFQQSAAIVGATVVVGLVIYLTVTVQDPQARSIFEFVLLLFCIPLAGPNGPRVRLAHSEACSRGQSCSGAAAST